MKDVEGGLVTEEKAIPPKPHVSVVGQVLVWRDAVLVDHVQIDAAVEEDQGRQDDSSEDTPTAALSSGANHVAILSGLGLHSFLSESRGHGWDKYHLLITRPPPLSTIIALFDSGED